MKHIEVFTCIIALFFTLSKCEKEPEYPTSIFGKWRYLGQGATRNNIPEDKRLTDIMEIKVDSMYFFESDPNKPYYKDMYPLEFIDDYYCESWGFFKQVIYVIYKVYPNGYKLSDHMAFEIKNDILILQRVDPYTYEYGTQFRFYKAYPPIN